MNKILAVILCLVPWLSLPGQIPYTVGATVSLEHRETDLPVCANGDSTLRLEDFDTAINGGEPKVLWLSFFTSWCVNCQNEIPQMAAFYNQYHQEGLEILSFGRQWNYPYSCEGWAGLGATYPLLNDDTTGVWQWFGLGYVPQNVFLDPTFTVRYSIVGFDPDQTAQILEELLSELNPLSVAGEEESALPQTFHLEGISPNPFNPEARVSFTVYHRRVSLRVRVLDVTGREIGVIPSRVYGPGSHELRWRNGQQSSGLVFFSLESPGERQIQKALLLK
ncbi:MAG: TlpA family protein disulfide reductase [Candidatus Neomarinimicrobiota bacterium]|nr:MAG: TlpA family protein disulfide reductase [Candidatus Neomarinimicrobiota bacterium]